MEKFENFNVALFESAEPNLTTVYPEKIREPEDSMLYTHLSNHEMEEVDTPVRERSDRPVRQYTGMKQLSSNLDRMMIPEPWIHTLVSLIHTLLAIFALYLSFICNKGFDPASFVAAACCPYIYILYVFAIRPDLCGIRR
jgi:hypothetical protein